MELWKDIPGFEGLYKANVYGQIKSLYTNKILKSNLCNNGYLGLTLCKNKIFGKGFLGSLCALPSDSLSTHVLKKRRHQMFRNSLTRQRQSKTCSKEKSELNLKLEEPLSWQPISRDSYFRKTMRRFTRIMEHSTTSRQVTLSR